MLGSDHGLWCSPLRCSQLTGHTTRQGWTSPSTPSHLGLLLCLWGHRILVNCEGVFSYLARDGGLRKGYVCQVSTAREVASGDLKRAAEYLRAHNVTAVFCKSVVQPGPKEQLMRETGTRDSGMPPPA